MTLMSGAPGTVIWRDTAAALWKSGMVSTGKVEASSAATEAAERAPASSRRGEAIVIVVVVPSTGDGRRRRSAFPLIWSSSEELVRGVRCSGDRNVWEGAGGPGRS